jgi:hypothetical protein
MGDDAVPWRSEVERTDRRPGGHADSGVIGQTLRMAARLAPVPPAAIAALLVAGGCLGALGDVLLRAPGPVGVNVSLWVASVAAAALMLQRHAGLALDRERVAWLAIGVVCAAGFAWRDAEALKLLALISATLAFALAAHRPTAVWVRHAGVVRYAAALVLGALQAWTAAALALTDAIRFTPHASRGRSARWRRATAIARGLALAAPLVLVFGALFMSADAVFEQIVTNVFHFDFEWIAGHVVLFSILAWLSTGYLRSFMTGTESRLIGGLTLGDDAFGLGLKRPTLGITEIGTALSALDLLFLLFVIVQFRYLFGGDALVQLTPDLTYADYARRGFFELVFAVALVVPVLLVADWLLDRRGAGDARVFRSLAGVQIVLVFAIAASALQRLRLYHASYGLTESRFYAMVLLMWIGAMLLWLAATVLRGRRDAFAFGTLASGLATIAVLFAISPDAIVARANVARMALPRAPERFDVAYATSLSADAVPVLIEALPRLPADVQCPLARHMLRRWPLDAGASIRSWNWAAARASHTVREHETALRSMVGPDQRCVSPAAR